MHQELRLNIIPFNTPALLSKFNKSVHKRTYRQCVSSEVKSELNYWKMNYLLTCTPGSV